MNILALDAARVTGWAIDFELMHGTFSCGKNSRQSNGVKFLKFRHEIKQLISIGEIELVVFEMPVVYSGRASSAISGGGFKSIIESTCEELGVAYKGYAPTEIKAHAKSIFADTVGRMNKEKMIQSAKRFWPDLHIIDDNHSDALWLLSLAHDDFL